MASILDVTAGICDHFAKCVYDVAPVGKNTKAWRRYNVGQSDQRLTQDAERVRLFEVYPDASMFEGVVQQHGGSEVDYNVTINIDVCYGVDDLHTMIAMRDYEAIRRRIFAAPSGHLTSYQFPTFSGFEWVERDNSKFRYIRIPVVVRITVTE